MPEPRDPEIINLSEILGEVTAAFRRYETAPIGSDLAVLDELFRKPPYTVRYGIAENLYGHHEIPSGYHWATTIG